VRGGSINQVRKEIRGEKRMNPLYPYFTETKCNQNVEDVFPVQDVKGFGEV